MSQKIPILTCKVAGVTFEGRQGTIRQLLKGADVKDILVRLEPEPDNPYDSGAIKVLAIPSHEQLGYIPKEVNEDLLQAMEMGMVHERQECTIGCTPKKNGGFIFWATIRVFKSKASPRREPPVKMQSFKRVIDIQHE